MPDAAAPHPYPAWVVAPAAVLLTLCQVGLAVLASGQPDLASGWRSLYQWDGGWYQSVLARGYYLPADPTKDDPGNLSFYPAYPLTAAAVRAAGGLDIQAALLVASQGACVGVWAYLLLLLRQFRVSVGNTVLVVALFACHPGALFLVASYSETTFLFGLLGFVYWCRRAGPVGFALAAAHGVLMTGGRAVGLPVVVLPLLFAAVGPSPRGWVRAAAVAVAATAGAAAYFAYLHAAFGRWDAFTVSYRAGWNITPDYLAFFRLKTWDYKFAELFTSHTDPAALNRMAFPLTVAHFLLLGVLEVLAVRRGSGGWRVRVPLLLAAGLLFAVPVMTHGARGEFGLVRFTLPCHAVLAVAAGSVLTDGPAWVRAWWVRVLFALGAVWAANAQWGMLRQFTAGTFIG